MQVLTITIDIKNHLRYFSFAEISGDVVFVYKHRSLKFILVLMITIDIKKQLRFSALLKTVAVSC